MPLAACSLPLELRTKSTDGPIFSSRMARTVNFVQGRVYGPLK
jgi:hypothetical protein